MCTYILYRLSHTIGITWPLVSKGWAYGCHWCPNKQVINFQSPLHNNKAASKTVLILANFTVQCSVHTYILYRLSHITGTTRPPLPKGWACGCHRCPNMQVINFPIPLHNTKAASKTVLILANFTVQSTYVHTSWNESYNRKDRYYLHIWAPMAPMSSPFGYGRLCNQFSNFDPIQP